VHTEPQKYRHKNQNLLDEQIESLIAPFGMATNYVMLKFLRSSLCTGYQSVYMFEYVTRTQMEIDKHRLALRYEISIHNHTNQNNTYAYN
jgi:hypothetical protein